MDLSTAASALRVLKGGVVTGTALPDDIKDAAMALYDAMHGALRAQLCPPSHAPNLHCHFHRRHRRTAADVAPLCARTRRSVDSSHVCFDSYGCVNR